MTQRDMAGFLNIDVKTLRNWRKNKPNLYKIIIQGFAIEDAIKKAEENAIELKKIFEGLNDKK
ncbi:hypothetical protein CRU87_03605 [Aliarcobacter trophiarum LMG 25534]|uniref:Transcriptional regulator n=1 Tax=Aliarcobacter trophiarum LMG 25534 TaxID=1032241 RepID=A0AAD0VMK3_9BACT|nr:hypothetical protein [Aliarcobacter trophiarum]AXK49518.1 hypothetical protein ATR_1695 [Aliarcobacter trophiarum LMG 25534]RXI27551.1 hypothetical protein CRU89_05865 [Aliarcobacter trophiarum]RXJ92200.1 hypothetical protein CRU87_03605 [Aliarcobacter trophiarum LMG 25534]